MNLLKQTKELCRLYDIKPARSKGQNFLINEDAYKKMIEAADIKKDDIILEVGPGLGFLTALLSQKAKKVIAVELDDKLANVLRTGLDAQDVKNVEVINENVLDLKIENYLPSRQSRETPLAPLYKGRYKVVANLPYNITSVFLRKFLSRENKPQEMVLMLQKEVAERIVACAGNMSLLTVSIQFYADAEIISLVPRRDFWPQPDVDSAIIKLKVKSEKLKVDEKSFFRLVKIGFSSKRKMLKNNLANGYHLKEDLIRDLLKRAGFSEKIRAQELSVEDWLLLLPYF